MLNDFVDQNTILDVALDLLGNRALLSIFIGTFLGREHDVDSGGLAGEDLSGETLRTEVDAGTIDLVQENSWNITVDLQSKLGGLDHVEAANKRVNNDGKAGAVVNGDSIGLAGNFDDGPVAARDEDRLGLLRRNLNDLVRSLEVFDQPLVAFQLLARGLASPHALGLGLFARNGRLAPGGAGAVGHCRACAQARVLMCHLRLVYLAQGRGDLLALVELVKHGRHICCRGSWGWRRGNTRRRWWRRSTTARGVHSWNRRGRRWWWDNTSRRRRRITLDLFQRHQCINTGVVIPRQALGVVLFEIGRKSLEVLVVCLNVLDVCTVPVKQLVGVEVLPTDKLTCPCTPLALCCRSTQYHQSSQ